MQQKPPHFTTAQTGSAKTGIRKVDTRTAAFWILAMVAAIFALTGAYFWGVTNASVTQVEILIPTPSPAVVQVVGEVNEPGVYELKVDDRVFAAIEAAGGTTENANIEGINLAAIIRDGSSIVIPRAKHLPPPTTEDSLPAGEKEADRFEIPTELQASNGMSASAIDLNTATTEQLKSLPGIGETRANQIISHRSSLGGFSSVDELMDINGIGKATVEAIRPFVTVQ